MKGFSKQEGKQEFEVSVKAISEELSQTNDEVNQSDDKFSYL